LEVKVGVEPMSEKGYIYILTNPSFPTYVKIGYADNVEDRVAQLNRTECTPFAFRIYATYEVSDRLKDIPVHQIIDQLNPTLRSIDDVEGKPRVREFYAMSPEDAYKLLEMIAKINGLECNLKLWKKSKEQAEDEKAAEKIETLSKNRHHFKDIDFSSSLTGKKYRGTTGDDGTLKILEVETGKEVPNNSKPSKKAIIGQAIIDLGGSTTKDETLYQRYHKLTKLILD
jgi:WD40 repeat protein